MTQQLPRTRENMRHGFLLRAELQRLAAHRMRQGWTIDSAWLYVAAATIDAVAPGKVPQAVGPTGTVFQQEYWKSWPRCLPENFLAAGTHAIAANLDEVPDTIVTGARKACADVQRRRHRGFLTAETIGRLLGLTVEERRLLRLTHIDAVDEPKAKREAAVKERRKARDRARAETKRRTAGVRPRGASIAEQAREAGISVGAMRVRLCRERAKLGAPVTRKSPRTEGDAVTRKSPLDEEWKYNSKSINCEGFLPPVTRKSPHKYPEDTNLRTRDVGNGAPSGARRPPTNGNGILSGDFDCAIDDLALRLAAFDDGESSKPDSAACEPELLASLNYDAGLEPIIDEPPPETPLPPPMAADGDLTELDWGSPDSEPECPLEQLPAMWRGFVARVREIFSEDPDEPDWQRHARADNTVAGRLYEAGLPMDSSDRKAAIRRALEVITASRELVSEDHH